MLSQSSFLFSITCTLSFHMRDGVHSTDSKEMESKEVTRESTAFTYNKLSHSHKRCCSPPIPSSPG